jgi:hypothetical protein
MQLEEQMSMFPTINVATVVRPSLEKFQLVRNVLLQLADELALQDTIRVQSQWGNSQLIDSLSGLLVLASYIL